MIAEVERQITALHHQIDTAKKTLRSLRELLSLTEHGQVRYSFKNPWRDGTTHVISEPFDFIARLAPLVLKPSYITIGPGH